MTDSRLAHKSLVIVPPPPPRFTLSEWYLNNSYTNRICLSQQKLADSIKAENDRTIGETEERTSNNKRETDCKLEERLEEITFLKGEIERQRKEASLEVEHLSTSIRRMEDCTAGLNRNAYQVITKCIILREKRIGIDLCHDIVERQLEKELDVLNGGKVLLQRMLEQATEQVFYFSF